MYKVDLIFISCSDTSKIKTILCSDKSKNTTEGRFKYFKQKTLYIFKNHEITYTDISLLKALSL